LPPDLRAIVDAKRDAFVNLTHEIMARYGARLNQMFQEKYDRQEGKIAELEKAIGTADPEAIRAQLAGLYQAIEGIATSQRNLGAVEPSRAARVKGRWGALADKVGMVDWEKNKQVVALSGELAELLADARAIAQGRYEDSATVFNGQALHPLEERFAALASRYEPLIKNPDIANRVENVQSYLTQLRAIQSLFDVSSATTLEQYRMVLEEGPKLLAALPLESEKFQGDVWGHVSSFLVDALKREFGALTHAARRVVGAMGQDPEHAGTMVREIQGSLGTLQALLALPRPSAVAIPSSILAAPEAIASITGVVQGKVTQIQEAAEAQTEQERFDEEFEALEATLSVLPVVEGNLHAPEGLAGIFREGQEYLGLPHVRAWLKAYEALKKAHPTVPVDPYDDAIRMLVERNEDVFSQWRTTVRRFLQPVSFPSLSEVNAYRIESDLRFEFGYLADMEKNLHAELQMRLPLHGARPTNVDAAMGALRQQWTNSQGDALLTQLAEAVGQARGMEDPVAQRALITNAIAYYEAAQNILGRMGLSESRAGTMKGILEGIRAIETSLKQSEREKLDELFQAEVDTLLASVAVVPQALMHLPVRTIVEGRHLARAEQRFDDLGRQYYEAGFDLDAAFPHTQSIAGELDATATSAHERVVMAMRDTRRVYDKYRLLAGRVRDLNLESPPSALEAVERLTRESGLPQELGDKIFQEVNEMRIQQAHAELRGPGGIFEAFQAFSRQVNNPATNLEALQDSLTRLDGRIAAFLETYPQHAEGLLIRVQMELDEKDRIARAKADFQQAWATEVEAQIKYLVEGVPVRLLVEGKHLVQARRNLQLLIGRHAILSRKDPDFIEYYQSKTHQIIAPVENFYGIYARRVLGKITHETPLEKLLEWAGKSERPLG
jgi:hypothetical protein